MDEKQIAEIIKTLVPTEKVYDDVASPALKEAGGALVSVINTAKIAFLPFELGEHVYYLLSGHLKRIFDQVSREKQIEPPLEIAGPVLEGLKYTSEFSVLASMFENLLARAIDKERAREAHPAFVTIIKQLAPDEALLLCYLRKGKHKEIIRVEPVGMTPAVVPEHLLVSPDLPVKSLDFPTYASMYLSRLSKLELIFTDAIPQVWSAPAHEEAEKIQIEVREWRLTSFGNLFAKACVPESLPEKSE